MAFSTSSTPTIEQRKDELLHLLTSYGQAHVLDAWASLPLNQKQELLQQIQKISWDQLHRLYKELVMERKVQIHLPQEPWEPAKAIERNRDEAKEAGLLVLKNTAYSLYGLIVVAGGTGSGLKFPHAKGMFPGTPLSETSLYQAIIGKSEAAARVYGHPEMFPIVFMLSEETFDETRNFFEKNNYFGGRDRIRLTKQHVLPLLDRRPGREGRVVMKSTHEIYVGGAGHGDAFDYTLTEDIDTLEWLHQRGVQYMHFLNVDNLLNPVGDPYFLGEHILSAASPVPGRAHISLLLIPKPETRRMGNIIQHTSNGVLLQESIDYGLIREVDERCDLGHASLQIVTLASLPGTEPIPFMVAEKEVSVGDEWVPVWKFERSSNNKARYGALLQRDSQEVFASIKKRSNEASVETPASSARLQSDHWRGILEKAAKTAGVSFEISPSTLLELPWEADHLPSETLMAHLERIRFPTQLKPEMGYWVLPEFRGFREIPLSAEIQTKQRTSIPLKGRRQEDLAPDTQRLRALIAHFNNHFEEEPEVLVRAPGRNTAIGDHLDYPDLPQDGSASAITIAWASGKNVLVAAKKRPDHGIKLLSINLGQTFTFSLDDLEGLAQEAELRNLPDVYGQELLPWAMSVMALLYSARHGRKGIRSPLPLYGAEFAFEGNIPIGAGQSSSAAYLVAMTLTCNELFNWGIPREDIFTLADLARSGEHEDYSPFIKKNKPGYLDQITSLSAQAGKAVAINHGNYRSVEQVDLSKIEEHGYASAIVLSGLNRSLGETDYVARVEELSRLPDRLNALLTQRRPSYSPKQNIHQFSSEEWKEIAEDLRKEDPALADRAHYIFEEKERTQKFIASLQSGDMSALCDVINASGEAMSMKGPYRISGTNEVPSSATRIPALDMLREIVRKHAGPEAAARMIGGGGAGPLFLLIKKKTFQNKTFAKEVFKAWNKLTGLTAKLEVDPPTAGAEVVWRQPIPTVLNVSGGQRIEVYADHEGQMVYRLVDGKTGMTAEILPNRGTVRSLTARIQGVTKAVLFNPEAKAVENGAAPYLGPWINRVKDGRASFRGQHINLMRVKGVRDDGHGHALHGLMTQGWHVDLEKTRIDEEGISLVSWIDSTDYTDDPGVQKMFGPARTVLTHRLGYDTLHISSTITHLGTPSSSKTDRIPVLAAVHPWFLLDVKKHPYAELTLPAMRRRITWKKAIPRLQMIPIPYLPSIPIPSFSRHFFREARRLGTEPYDHTYTHLNPSHGVPYPVALLKDWFRDMMVEVGVVKGYDEFTVYRPGGNVNVVCLEPQISSINALGRGAPWDAQVPTIGPGESYSTRMFIRVTALSSTGIRSAFMSPHVLRSANKPLSSNFPALISSGLEKGPLNQPLRTATHKDAIRIFFADRWHIYGTGHEMRSSTIPLSTRRPYEGSVMFHLVSPSETGPFIEEPPVVLLGNYPPGVYEAPGLIVEGDTLHLFAQTTYYKLGGTIEHFVSKDGAQFTWVGTALRSIPGGLQAGIYDVDIADLPADKNAPAQRFLVYSGFSIEGGRNGRPDPRIFLATNDGGLDGLFKNGSQPILADTDVPWHNSHDPANPFYEWGLEGAQLIRLPNGNHLLLCVGFEKRPGRNYMPAQRLFFALYDKNLKLKEVSDPILPLIPGWDEYGHGSMMIDVNNKRRLRLLFQARPANDDRAFRDSNTWRLFEALFDIGHLSQ